MPTIYHRSRLEMVGTLPLRLLSYGETSRFCPPYGAAN